MTKEDYIRQIRNLDEYYYDVDLKDFSFKELKRILDSIKYPYAVIEREEDHSTAFGGEEVIHYSNGRIQRRRRYQW